MNINIRISTSYFFCKRDEASYIKFNEIYDTNILKVKFISKRKKHRRKCIHSVLFVCEWARNEYLYRVLNLDLQRSNII